MLRCARADRPIPPAEGGNAARLHALDFLQGRVQADRANKPRFTLDFLFFSFAKLFECESYIDALQELQIWKKTAWSDYAFLFSKAKKETIVNPVMHFTHAVVCRVCAHVCLLVFFRAAVLLECVRMPRASTLQCVHVGLPSTLVACPCLHGWIQIWPGSLWGKTLVSVFSSSLLPGFHNLIRQTLPGCGPTRPPVILFAWWVVLSRGGSVKAAGLRFTDSSRYLFAVVRFLIAFCFGLVWPSAHAQPAFSASRWCIPPIAVFLFQHHPPFIYILSFWQMEVGEIFLLSSQPLYFHSFRFITLRPALLYSAPQLKYVPKSWWLLLARLLYFPANFSILSSVPSFLASSSTILLTSPFSSSFPISSAQMRCCIRRGVRAFLISNPSRQVLGGEK